ncbi:hypothetical protein L1987_66550 [Smallanthus sonchifolius]|uniref:Uncharacterized protein n=1 Tax=Smallanthus sonchifolius TaxID=185202 RepID=A0ACB9BXL1_9ASTR|nr:hypothetical protein L1987_66550 [Smallanthus sonchifolius]
MKGSMAACSATVTANEEADVLGYPGTRRYCKSEMPYNLDEFMLQCHGCQDWDIDGSKVQKALREKCGEEGYVEGDVIRLCINLPDGNLYATKYKGTRIGFVQRAKLCICYRCKKIPS